MRLSTYTYARLPIDPVMFDEIKHKLLVAGYDQTVINDGKEIDMQEISLVPSAPVPALAQAYPLVLYFPSSKEAHAFIQAVKEACPHLIERKV